MKRLNSLIVVFSTLLLCPPLLTSAQDLSTYNMIGEKLSTVITKYGKPVHHDKSEPEMECVFYKTKTYQMVYVANQQGVYQVQGFNIYSDKASAEKMLNDLLADCKKKGFTTDTLNVSEYDLRAKNIEVKFSLFENPHSHKYELKMEAFKREG